MFGIVDRYMARSNMQAAYEPLVKLQSQLQQLAGSGQDIMSVPIEQRTKLLDPLFAQAKAGAAQSGLALKRAGLGGVHFNDVTRAAVAASHEQAMNGWAEMLHALNSGAEPPAGAQPVDIPPFDVNAAADHIGRSAELMRTALDRTPLLHAQYPEYDAMKGQDAQLIQLLDPPPPAPPAPPTGSPDSPPPDAPPAGQPAPDTAPGSDSPPADSPPAASPGDASVGAAPGPDGQQPPGAAPATDTGVGNPAPPTDGTTQPAGGVEGSPVPADAPPPPTDAGVPGDAAATPVPDTLHDPVTVPGNGPAAGVGAVQAAPMTDAGAAPDAAAGPATSTEAVPVPANDPVTVPGNAGAVPPPEPARP
jgi:hypothetical protein